MLSPCAYLLDNIIIKSLFSFKRVRVRMFTSTFNNISNISWRSVLLVKETGVPGKTTKPSQVIAKLYHIMLYRVYLFELTTLVVIGTYWKSRFRSNYHSITTTTPFKRFCHKAFIPVLFYQDCCMMLHLRYNIHCRTKILVKTLRPIFSNENKDSFYLTIIVVP